MFKAMGYVACALVLSFLFTSPVVCDPVVVQKVSSGQRAAALEFLSAVASGDPQAVAASVHPDDLRSLRLRMLGMLHEEARKGDSTLRSRLFGPGLQLDEIERLTDTGFYATLAYKLTLNGREYSDVEGLAAIPDKDNSVQVVVRARQPRDHGKVEVVNVVTLKPYGKDWKAALPGEIRAQIDDLIEGRHIAVAAPAHPATGDGEGRAAAVAVPVPPAIVELLNSAEKSLNDGKCDDYYNKQMSPNFRRVTGQKALEALVSRCRDGMGTRQLLLSTLHIVRGLTPRFEDESQRAVFDLSGEGLPYQSFTVEQVDKRWYIAE
jgi:hypothetical protein